MKLPENTKILTLDIEFRPVKAFVWRAWKENIRPAQIIEDGGILCVGLKWLGKPETYLFSEWEHGHKAMLEAVHAMMSEADAIVTYNGLKYDQPKLNGEFLLHGLAPMAPLTSIDCLKAVKKFGFFQNNLAYIGPFLGLGRKMEHEGFALWVKVMKGDPVAQRKMARYCRRDVKLTERLYLKIRPFIVDHPHMGDHGIDACGACGGKHLQSRGWRRTKGFRIQRIYCASCGSWQSGTRKKV